jgi:hypothetical protein
MHRHLGCAVSVGRRSPQGIEFAHGLGYVWRGGNPKLATRLEDPGLPGTRAKLDQAAVVLAPGDSNSGSGDERCQEGRQGQKILIYH